MFLTPNNTTHTKAADVASLRPSAAARPSGAMSRSCSYSNASSRKLYSLLTSLHAKGGYSHTFGALDPVQVIQMAPRKFNDLLFWLVLFFPMQLFIMHYCCTIIDLSSIYVSGWQCSSTASSTNEPGPDFADYPMDTVPKKCKFSF